MKIYIAGASREVKTIENYMALATLHGIEISQDWTKWIRESKTRVFTRDENISRANADIEAIDESDLMWLIIPKETSIGCYVELGYALALNCMVISSGHVSESNIFALLVDEHYETNEAAYARILKLNAEYNSKYSKQ